MACTEGRVRVFGVMVEGKLLFGPVHCDPCEKGLESDLESRPPVAWPQKSKDT